MPDYIYILIAILGIWNLILTYLFIQLSTRINGLYSGPKGATLIKILEDIISKSEKNTNSISSLTSEIGRIIKSNNFNFQKMGVVKFNPFNELGGSHSFVICLLTGENSGFVITGLHARDKTRLYLKSIEMGKSTVALSDEEEKALKIALKK